MFVGSHCRGVTLTELIVAMSIVSVIMLGVVSIDYAIRKQSVNAQAGAYTDIYAQGIVQAVLASASAAVGGPTDPGIMPNPLSASAHSFCFRTDATAPTWVCFTNPNGLNASGNLYRCTRSSNGDCTNADLNLGAVLTVVPQFTTNNTQGSQTSVFTVAVTVSDSTVDGSQRTVTGSVSPLGYTI